MAFVWIRALIYVLIVGAGWLVVLPSGLLLWETGSLYPAWNIGLFPLLGGLWFVSGLCLAWWAGFCLIQFGRGTPLPLDPPHRLVTSGPYAFVRNPQAIAMVLMVGGEIFAIRSAVLWLLLPATLAYLELLVGPWEALGGTTTVARFWSRLC